MHAQPISNKGTIFEKVPVMFYWICAQHPNIALISFRLPIQTIIEMIFQKMIG